MLTLDRRRQRGTSLVEVLVTLVILAFALLGVAGLQAKSGVAEMESYQRAQALILLQDMADRIRANAAQAANYVSASTIGTGDTQPADCTGIAQGPNRDLCEWSNALKGAGETKAGATVGSMIGARGCITQVQPANVNPGACASGIYEVDVAWQGMSPTAVPALACGLGAYGANDAFRRVVSVQVSVATTSCF